MATKTFTSFVQMEKVLNHAITEAVRYSAQRITKKLKECIDEQYYHDSEFFPNVYDRTETFLKSATYTLLSGNSAEIFIDGDGMHYKNGFDPWQIISWASDSMHGSPLYQTSTEDFWTTFINWMNDNALIILREELKKQGIKTV